MEPNQLKKIVVPAVVVAGLILAVGGLFLLNDPGSTGTVVTKLDLSGNSSMEGMSGSLPPTDSTEYKDIGAEGLSKFGTLRWVKEKRASKGRRSQSTTLAGSLMRHVFDTTANSNEPTTFPLGRLVVGWQRGIPGMKPGGIRRLYIPAKLGYGSQDKGDIPPNSDLVFEIKLIRANGGS